MQKKLLKNLTYSSHKPVLLQEACDFLSVTPGGRYIDATYGGGGHTAEIIQRGGQVLAFDQDSEAIAASVKTQGVKLVKSNFMHLTDVAKAHAWLPVQGIVFDLGLSSHHIDVAARGFSFQKEGPLDMRMDQDVSVTAGHLVNQLPAEALTRLLKNFGEIPVAKLISERIVASRPIETTSQLAKISGQWSRQVFQALRIAVNDELGALTHALPQAWHLLDAGGRLVIITFHSLEDRIVKDQFKEWVSQGVAREITTKPIVPTEEETTTNPRSKSAKLRSIEKIK